MATIKSSFKIILGSSSMARRKILAEMGYEFTIMTADIDEKAIRKEKPEELVMALAEAKADAIIARMQDTTQLQTDTDPTLLITADTVVIYKGTIREKPSSKQEAEEFIKDYSGGHAGVVGSVLITNLKTGARKGGWEKAEVYFYDIPPEAIHDLIEEGTTLNVAGGLMLEHPLTLPFVETVVYRVILLLLSPVIFGHVVIYLRSAQLALILINKVGAYDTVMGLSKALTDKLMRDAL